MSSFKLYSACSAIILAFLTLQAAADERAIRKCEVVEENHIFFQSAIGLTLAPCTGT